MKKLQAFHNNKNVLSGAKIIIYYSEKRITATSTMAL